MAVEGGGLIIWPSLVKRIAAKALGSSGCRTGSGLVVATRQDAARRFRLHFFSIGMSSERERRGKESMRVGFSE